MQAVMGPLPGAEKRCALDVKVEEEADCGSYVRRLITYQAEPGGRVPAYLCIPKAALNSAKKFPGALCLHPTDNNAAAGGAVTVNPQGLYEKLCAEHGLPLHPIPGSDAIIPYPYTDDVPSKGRELLRRAREALRGEEDLNFLQRVRFLEGGLDELTALREVLIAARALKQDKRAAHQKQCSQTSNQLLELRRRLTKEGVLWGDIAYDREMHRGIPTLPEASKAKNQNYDGL